MAMTQQECDMFTSLLNMGIVASDMAPTGVDTTDPLNPLPMGYMLTPRGWEWMQYVYDNTCAKQFYPDYQALGADVEAAANQAVTDPEALAAFQQAWNGNAQAGALHTIRASFHICITISTWWGKFYIEIHV